MAGDGETGSAADDGERHGGACVELGEDDAVQEEEDEGPEGWRQRGDSAGEDGGATRRQPGTSGAVPPI